MENYLDCIVSTRIRLARNIANRPFPHMLNGKRDERLIKEVCNACDKLFKYDIYDMCKLDEIERIALLERHYISPKLAENIENGMVIISDQNGVSIMLNEEDHIRAQCVLEGYNFEQAYKNIKEFDSALAKTVEIAYSEQFGYLTACPTNLGTGMRASVMMFLPALTISGSIIGIINSVQKTGITARGVYGEGSDSEGYMYQISNQASIGISEREIINLVGNIVEKICEEERKARLNLHRYNKVELEDKIMRAYGLLKYAVKISSKEFMEAISLVKLGVNLQILNLDLRSLNELIEVAQPASLCHYSGRILGDVERDVERAKVIKNSLK